MGFAFFVEVQPRVRPHVLASRAIGDVAIKISVSTSSLYLSPPTLSMASSTPADSDPPPLSIYTTTDSADREAALRLIADSIAQQRQVAARSFTLHPLTLAVALALLAWGYQALLPRGIGTALSTLSGLSMLALVSVRKLTSPYILAAEAIHQDFLDEGEVVVAKFGEAIVSTAVWGWIPEGKKRKGLKAEVRAWTTKLRYRGTGVGTGIVETVCDEIKKKGGEGVEFAADHASELKPTKSLTVR